MNEIMRETIEEFDARYEQIWMTTPPAIGIRYQVTREQWNTEHTERTIYEYRLRPDA